MTVKTFGRAAPAAATPTVIFTGSANGDVFNARIVNSNATAVTIKLGASTTAAFEASGYYISNPFSVPGTGHVELTGLAIGADENLIFETDTTLVNCVAYGTER